ncbi:MAG: biopolymer transporter ExbD [Acidobacteria bacterium]|nr:biopolymer transporter ExbD [Acidobacteriota bacterium]
MAISGSAEIFRTRGRLRAASSISEINVTPFVDVLLVLLIIFMLTAHVMEFGIEVDVPKVRPQKESVKELPVISIPRSGELYLNEKAININDLVPAIRKRFGKNASVYVRADKDTIFDPIAQVLAVLGEAKIGTNVVTKPDEGKKGR